MKKLFSSILCLFRLNFTIKRAFKIGARSSLRLLLRVMATVRVVPSSVVIVVSAVTAASAGVGGLEALGKSDDDFSVGLGADGM